MPLYDYRCTACGREVEVMHGIYDSGPSECQHCGGAMRKALSPPAIHFKGSGWAKKDAAASVKKSAPKAGSSSSGESSASESDGADKASSSKDSKSTSGSASETAGKATTTASSTSD